MKNELEVIVINQPTQEEKEHIIESIIGFLETQY